MRDTLNATSGNVTEMSFVLVFCVCERLVLSENGVSAQRLEKAMLELNILVK